MLRQKSVRVVGQETSDRAGLEVFQLLGEPVQSHGQSVQLFASVFVKMGIGDPTTEL